jgi:NAD(P)-dependent dehydrogenase (short-subunit alcohol dehydrogenase family)
VCDVTKLDAVEHLADEAFRLLGEVHLVFNNAGIAYAGPIADVTHGDWRWVIDVDLWGPVHGVEAFLPRLLEQGGDRHLVFTSSFAGLVANAGLGPYSVSKFGVVALAEGLARELKAEGIGVSVLCPMIVDTPLIANSLSIRSDDYGARTTLPEETVQALAAPTDEKVRADDVARLTADAVLANRLYILPHKASRESIRRRFERIDRTFDEQIAGGWSH